MYNPLMIHHESMSHFYALGPNPMFSNNFTMAPNLTTINPYFYLN